MTEVIVPGTGELLDLSATPTTELAEVVANVSDLQAEITRFKRAASDEIADRLDHEGRRSAEVGGFKLKVNAPLTRAWDIEKLMLTLERFVEEGQISREKADRCIRNKPEVAAREVGNLLSDPRTAPEISLCYEDVPANRYVTVEEA